MGVIILTMEERVVATLLQGNKTFYPEKTLAASAKDSRVSPSTWIYLDWMLSGIDKAIPYQSHLLPFVFLLNIG